MQFPESWLRHFCNPPLNTQQLADTLTMAGLEVEEVRPVAPAFSSVVVGEVVHVEPHPNADRLRVCTVNVGADAPLNIVCGAPNARPGIRVPCAMVGAELPSKEGDKPFRIKLGKLRGVESQGMLCSGQELGIPDDRDGLLELAVDAPVGMDIRAHLGLDDSLFTLKLTPNLAHCLSVYGVARELSGITGAPLRNLDAPVVPSTHAEVLPVTVNAPELCGRFSGRVIKNINPAAKTPEWMVGRLARCGQRSVNALVDISNYVMFERGQPTHIFDLARLNGGLCVRWGRAGETLKLLNGQEVTLDESVGVIADESTVESLAGIMGGDSTAVSDDTRHIYVEAAFWWPQAVAGRSRRFNFSTDAGHRFERGVDPSRTVDCIEHITRLVLDICGGEAGPLTDVQPHMPVSQPVTLRIARAEKVIGMPLGQPRCKAALQGLGLAVTDGEGSLTVTPPPYRFDLQIEADLIEEVARVVGYDNLPTTPPIGMISAKVHPEAQRNPFDVRRLLASLGYQETINFSFVDEAWERDWAGNTDPIRLLNPIASHMGVMRSSLMGSLLNVARFNIDRKAERVCIFEAGKVFLRDPSVENSDTTVAGFRQPEHLAGLVYGPVQPLSWEGKARYFDFYDAKGHVEKLLAPRAVEFRPCHHPALHPGKCAEVVLNGTPIGHVGELHPRWRQALGWTHTPVLFELDFDAVLTREVPVFHSFGKHQMVERDLAVWVPETLTHARLMQIIQSSDPQGLIRSATLFDVYRPKDVSSGGDAEGQKSVAVRLVLQRPDAGLTEADIEQVLTHVLQSLTAAVGARIRA